MAQAVAVYVVSENFLLPAMVSAFQARRFSSRELIDVLILCVGEPSERISAVIRIAQKNGVEIRCVPDSFLEGRKHTYGRLVVHKVLPPHYQRIVYLDGDTQVAGSLDPLVQTPLAADRFMAVRDTSHIYARLSPEWRSRLERDQRESGYTGAFDDYVNAGILVMNREGWPALAERTLALFDPANMGKHMDQDLINRAILDHCVHISIRWNFPGFLIGTQIEAEAKPVIYHFMSNPRPWNVAAKPWGRAKMEPYDRLLQEYPELQFLAPTQRTLKNNLKYMLLQNYKTITEYRHVGHMRPLPPDIDI